MAAALTITGAAFEVIGLGLVFVELAVIRSHEFGVATPWARAISWIRVKLGRPKVVQLRAAISAEFALKARGTVRPGPAAADATESERIQRLERYVERLDEDLDRHCMAGARPARGRR